MPDHRAPSSPSHPSPQRVPTPSAEGAVVEDLASPLTPEQEEKLHGGLRRGGEPGIQTN